MVNEKELIKILNERLKNFKYGMEDHITIPNVSCISYVKEPAPFKVRNLCAILNVPENITDDKKAKKFFEVIRSNLLQKYGDAFLWKELEMMFVVFCDHHLFELFKKDNGIAIDITSFSLSSMLGSCFIDKSNYESFHHSTWGIYFSGDHFRAVNKLVTEWCQKNKSKL